MELPGEKGRAETESKEAEQVERVTARRTANLPGGGEDCVHHGVLVISGAKQEDVLCERKRDRFLFLMINTIKKLSYLVLLQNCCVCIKQLMSPIED